MNVVSASSQISKVLFNSADNGNLFTTAHNQNHTILVWDSRNLSGALYGFGGLE